VQIYSGGAVSSTSSLEGETPPEAWRALVAPRDEIAALLRITEAVSGERDRDALLGALAGAFRGVLPADRLLVLSQGSLPTRVFEVPSGRELSELGSEPALVAELGRAPSALVFPSLARAPQGAAWIGERLIEHDMKSALALPLRVGERSPGALVLLSAVEDAWSSVPGSLLDGIARAVAAALESCLAHEELQSLQREREVLLALSSASGRHLKRDELFGALSGCLRDLLPTDRFGIELPLEGGRLQGHLLTPRGGRAEVTQPHVLPAPGTACQWVLANRERMVTACRDELRERFPVTFSVMEREGMESLCALPLLIEERSRAVLFVMAARRSAYQGVPPDLLDQLSGSVAVALDDCLAHEEVERLRDRLAAENVYLREEIQQAHNFEEIVGCSEALQSVLRELAAVAPTEATVLIYGETGTGKELVARAIHAGSPRASRPLIKVNCAAISAGLVESELFGHEKGAFTGAADRHIGRFELAHGGTIFLDEVGELPFETQAKLLRVLQEREFERVGGSTTLRADVRVIAATNRDLPGAVERGLFREDLYYRLSVFPLRLPALRERREDIELLAHYFLERHARRLGRGVSRMSTAILERLRAYSWPGNVRELENAIERALVLSQGPELEVGPLIPLSSPVAPREESACGRDPWPEVKRAEGSVTLASVSTQHLRAVLERCAWVIEGPDGAARALGLRPSTLRSRMKKLGLQRPPLPTPRSADPLGR
jgi:formate hydrogenlyase transcriptional activator